MKARNPLRFANGVAAALLSALAGCSRNQDLGPPRILPGQTECAECRMLIAEERHAAALVCRDAAGVTKLAFDDIGCLLRRLRSTEPAPDARGYLHDFESGDWIEARGAWLLRSQKLNTPMGSQLVACRSEEAARRLAHDYPGNTVPFDALARPDAPEQDAARAQTAERGIP